MLVTFGSAKPKRTESRNTKLDIVLKDGSILSISANVVPQIAESIQRRPVNLKTLDNWNYLWNEFSLADDLPTERETSSVELANRKRLLLGHYTSTKDGGSARTLHAWFQTGLDFIRANF